VANFQHDEPLSTQGMKRMDDAAEVLPFIAVLWGPDVGLAWSQRCTADAACLFWAAGKPRRIQLQAIILPLLLLSGSYVVTLYVVPNLCARGQAAREPAGQYIVNQQRLSANRTNAEGIAGPVREGLCLLQGLLLCGDLLFTATIAVVRQKFHLSSCPNFRDRL
jgi:hypothetical protein